MSTEGTIGFSGYASARELLDPDPFRLFRNARPVRGDPRDRAVVVVVDVVQGGDVEAGDLRKAEEEFRRATRLAVLSRDSTRRSDSLQVEDFATTPRRERQRGSRPTPPASLRGVP